MASQRELQLGINEENLKVLKRKLEESIGKKWVSDDPSVMISYSRDVLTPIPEKRPQMVVLPESTEEVQKIVRIAKEHKVPVLPVGQGFSHSGLHVPRLGGIVLDLKRMNKILEIDEESMTITIQPNVGYGLVNTEAYQHCGVDDIPLRCASPLSSGACGLLVNYVYSGLSGTALKDGEHWDNIVSMTWVLPDGEILKTGTAAYPNVDPIGGVKGPGPDLGGALMTAAGTLGICTEITICLFNEYNHKANILLGTTETDYGVVIDKLVEFYYAIGHERQDLIEDAYRIGTSIIIPMMSEEMYIAMEGQMPLNIMFMTIAGLTEEDVEIKKRRLDGIVGEFGVIKLPPEMEAVFLSLLGFEDETDYLRHAWRRGRCPVKLLTGGLVGNSTRGAYSETGCLVKLEHVPEMQKEYYKICLKYFQSTVPGKIGRYWLPAESIFQGPMPFGRYVFYSFQNRYNPSNPEEMLRLQRVWDRIDDLKVKYGCGELRTTVYNAEKYLPRMGTYYEILKQYKELLDPDNIMHPDVMPLTEDYV